MNYKDLGQERKSAQATLDGLLKEMEKSPTVKEILQKNRNQIDILKIQKFMTKGRRWKHNLFPQPIQGSFKAQSHKGTKR